MPEPLSIVIPAFNEEHRLAITVRGVLEAARAILPEFQIIIVNDGSSDGTAAIADQLQAQHAEIEVMHFPENRGVGAAFFYGLQNAKHDYLTLVPGDNAFQHESIARLFEHVGLCQVVVSYRENMQCRTRLRRWLSRCCTFTMRIVAGCPIRDAHSLYVFPVEEARQVRPNPGYGYHLETLSTLLRGKLIYRELPVYLTPRPDYSSQVMRWPVLFSLMLTMLRQLWKFVILGRKQRFTNSPVKLLHSH